MKSTLHDWKHRYWGNDYNYQPEKGGLRARLIGWRVGLKRGDVLILYGGGGNRASYVIDEITYERDPSDMFVAQVHYEQGLVVEKDGSFELTREVRLDEAPSHTF
jgi:hypothetical protein